MIFKLLLSVLLLSLTVLSVAFAESRQENDFVVVVDDIFMDSLWIEEKGEIQIDNNTKQFHVPVVDPEEEEGDPNKPPVLEDKPLPPV